MCHEELRKHILDTKGNIELFFDIETFKYNEKAGREHPTKYKGGVYSVAVSWLDKDDNIHVELWPRFEDMFDFLQSVNRVRHYKLIAHNAEKFDNHYLLKDLCRYYHLKRKQRKLANTPATKEIGFNKSNLKGDDYYTLESRVKSRSNLSFFCKMGKVSFDTQDTVPITHQSLDTISTTLHRFGFMPEENMKTDLDYRLYDVDFDMTYEQERTYAKECWDKLNESQLTYIKNDVIILAELRLHYSDIFPGFSWDVLTISQNILSSYILDHVEEVEAPYLKEPKKIKIYNQMARFQLLLKAQFLRDYQLRIENAVKRGKKSLDLVGSDDTIINLTDFNWSSDLTMYGHMKKFYKGGLNFYNDKFVGKSIDEQVKGYDINSSYPNVMYNFDIPTFLTHINTNPGVITIEKIDKVFSFIEVDITTFNKLMDLIPSQIIRKMLVKYYTNLDENVYINTNTLRIIMTFSDRQAITLPYLSITQWRCVPFGAKKVISDFYFVKTQGKANKKLIYNGPSDIELSDEDNTQVFTKAEVSGAKLNLNGIYGIPALRPYFNYFLLNSEGEYENAVNGFENSSRNIVFASFVTSQALFNLLDFLRDCPAQMIDDNFLYCDTDSMYFKAPLAKYISDEQFHPRNLGAWECEHENIEHFMVLNHKKYAYYDKEEGGLRVRAGGIKDGSFNLDMPWEQFIEQEFHEGAIVPVIRSVLADDGSMIIYDSQVDLSLGKEYQDYMSEENKFGLKFMAHKAMKEWLDNPDEDYEALYVETDLGTLSIQDIFKPNYKPNEVYTTQEMLLKSYEKVAHFWGYDML